MNSRDKLTGMLIGLARATFGNDDIITPDTYPVIIRRLCAADDEIDTMIDTVRQEKYRIVPDCAVCTVKCGRNDDFDMAQLDNEPETERKLKLRLLKTAGEVAACVKDTGTSDEETNSFFTKALMMAGTEGLPAEFLGPVIEEGEELKKKYI